VLKGHLDEEKDRENMNKLLNFNGRIWEGLPMVLDLFLYVLYGKKNIIL
jgi:hypothetical protein